MLDAQTLQCTPDLRRSRAINFAARRRRVKIMRAPVRIKAHGKAMRAKHLRQRTERRGRSFLLDQKRRINRARRIIQSHNQIERRLARQPHMHRAVLMQHHARKRQLSTPLARLPN